MELVQCIYCSVCADPKLSLDNLNKLLESCRKRNGEVGVSGMLLFHEGSFFQVLEGERAVVEPLFEKIARDPRHNRVTKLILEPIEERSFAAWTMGHAKVAAPDLARIPGLNDFFTSGKSYLELGEGRAKTLLNAFKEGRWRVALS